MATTFVLEELDAATREYLIEVRDREGRGAPGIFAPTKNPWPAVGCIVGPIIIGLTLILTLAPGVRIIFDEPTRVAMLQTAGLLLGGWMLIAAFRVWARKGSKKVAGNWVYADPLFLYEAKGEQVNITDVTEVIESQYTHNYNNGAYQNSVVRLLLPGNHIASVTLNHEQRAENMVVYYNYLAWARGPEGGERSNLPPATLGGLAKYVARNDNEPLDAENNVNLSMIELDIDEVPEEPHREGRALPNIIPYVVLVLAGVACFFVMQEVNIPIRDDAIFQDVTEPREYIQPRGLRDYLFDPRNTRHREQVYQHLETFYIRTVIPNVRTGNGDPELREGMARVLEELKRADAAIVSIRVTEKQSPAGKESGAAERAKNLQSGVTDRILEVFAQWEPPIKPRTDETFKETQPPIGRQLIDFVQAPDEAKPHFDISYEFVPAENNQYKLNWTITIRDKVVAGEEQPPPVAGPKTLTESQAISADSADTAINSLKESIARALIGTGGGVAAPFPKFPQIPNPGFK
jgi:hypothetical protein